jgi:hypothetical protein
MEFSTEVGRRVYCFKCRAFIGKNQGEKKPAVCRKCGERTCSKCKRRYHGSDPCPTQKELEKTLKLIKEQGWKKCPKCGRVIQRVKGTCTHIT